MSKILNFTDDVVSLFEDHFICTKFHREWTRAEINLLRCILYRFEEKLDVHPESDYPRLTIGLAGFSEHRAAMRLDYKKFGCYVLSRNTFELFFEKIRLAKKIIKNET